MKEAGKKPLYNARTDRQFAARLTAALKTQDDLFLSNKQEFSLRKTIMKKIKEITKIKLNASLS